MRGFLLLLLFSASSCVYSLQPRIIGGQNTSIDKYPYQVSVQARNSHICGGSLISDQFVLTAAHCVYGEFFKDIRIRMKSSYTQKDGVLISNVKIMWHNLYRDNSADYDIALIKLPTPVKDVKPIKLADASANVPDGSNAVVTGWGRQAANGPTAAILQVATVPTINWNVCKKKFAEYKLQVTERMICASNLNVVKNVCQGDSGGPLVFKGVQIGIVSWGDGCINRAFYGVYTRVSALNSWIQNTMKQM
ncbi:vitellin-degrading protease [Megachile rotundata]|uniref:vitellin-degrading protease n=1 Tax=Megachile rotundata TaxID=143995 RepID=UPI003FD48668